MYSQDKRSSKYAVILCATSLRHSCFTERHYDKLYYSRPWAVTWSCCIAVHIDLHVSVEIEHLGIFTYFLHDQSQREKKKHSDPMDCKTVCLHLSSNFRWHNYNLVNHSHDLRSSMSLLHRHQKTHEHHTNPSLCSANILTPKIIIYIACQETCSKTIWG